MPISIAQAYEPVEVDLWGELHKTRPITRSIEKKIDAVKEQIDKAETTDQAVKGLAKLISLQIGDDGIAQTIEAKWKADELTVNQLIAFADSIAAADRPI